MNTSAMHRRNFIKHGSLALIATSTTNFGHMTMNDIRSYDAIIIGGSYSGLSAALALSRARRSVLVIDANEPCNARVPHSHNLLTHDGEPPHVLRAKARADVAKYPTVQFHDGRAVAIDGANGAFFVETESGEKHQGRKLILALGVRDELPAIKGLAECWGVSAAACPFCHGYEVRDKRIAIIGNAPETIDYAHLIRNWTEDLTVLTNGPSLLDETKLSSIEAKGIKLVHEGITEVLHDKGQVKAVVFADGRSQKIDTLFLRSRTTIPTLLTAGLGVGRSEADLINVDFMQRTNVPGVYACGDCTTPMRSLSTAMASGTMAGASIVHELIHS